MTRAGRNVLRWAAFFPLACLIGILLGSGEESGPQVFSSIGILLSAFATMLTASRVAPRWPVWVGLGTALVLALLLLRLNALVFYAGEAKTTEYAPAVSSFLGGLAALLIIRRWQR